MAISLLRLSTSALLLILGSNSYVKAQNNGDTICVDGYIMDRFCIDRGTLLDDSSTETLKNPERHSIHCLVDVGVCKNSPFHILEDQGNFYGEGWSVTDNDPLIDLARAVGRCSTCDGDGNQRSGFQAAVRGVVVDANTKVLQIEEVAKTGTNLCSNQPAPTDPPTNPPTSKPTQSPTRNPTSSPTSPPSPAPTPVPTPQPTPSPTANPTSPPSPVPTPVPSPQPTPSPTANPTSPPSPVPTPVPSPQPTPIPTAAATSPPTTTPTRPPTDVPTPTPTRKSTHSPTRNPTKSPTRAPTDVPTRIPTRNPTHTPTRNPSRNPTRAPTGVATRTPTRNPTRAPTDSPTHSPTRHPTRENTDKPTESPTDPPVTETDASTTHTSTDSPGAATNVPTPTPTRPHTRAPTDSPTRSPTRNPTRAPTDGSTRSPTRNPTRAPTDGPTIIPTRNPTGAPTVESTESPTDPHVADTDVATTDTSTDSPRAATDGPTHSATRNPTQAPTNEPTESLTDPPVADPDASTIGELITITFTPSATPSSIMNSTDESMVDCSDYQHELQVPGFDDVTLQYVVNYHNLEEDSPLVGDNVMRRNNDTVYGTMSVRIEYKGQGWIGFAVSPTGGMLGSDAVLGVPSTKEDGNAKSGGSVKKYHLSFDEGANGYVLLGEEQQTLIDASIVQDEDSTVMEFTKLLVEEEGEIPINGTGINYFLIAHGTDTNELGYQAPTGMVDFNLTLSPCMETLDMEKQNVTVGTLLDMSDQEGIIVETGTKPSNIFDHSANSDSGATSENQLGPDSGEVLLATSGVRRSILEVGCRMLVLLSSLGAYFWF